MYIKIPKNKIEKIQIIKTNCKKTLQQVVATYKPDYVINGGLYSMKTGKPNAIPLRIDGKTIATSKYGYWTMCWNDGPDICVDHSSNLEKWQNGVACVAMLKDGLNTTFNFNTAQGGTRGRTGFGDDDKNVHIFVTTDKSGALSPYSLRDKMKAEGCKNAIMLDCGGSSQMYATGKYYQAEKRMVSYWICIWMKKNLATDDPSICPYNEPTTNVRFGTTGDSVRWIQWHLRASTAPEMTVDGVFGTKTKTAVVEFQETYGVTADGIVGKATRRVMKNVVEDA